MSSIDERVVNMKFNNSAFMNGIKNTLDALSNLKKGLNFDSSKKSLDDLNTSGKNFDLGHIGTTVEGVSGKFLALATIGVTALANIANSAINAGKTLISSLTIDPIKAGLQEYETNLNSIQTILANTQASGSTLKDVNAALQELNTYSDQTIYNFSEMARNIGTFTAAGVNLETSTAAIKGIANLAALSGSNSQQASSAMYQLSQAISSGKVSLMDWNSVVNAGMGGTVFQRALAETAVKMGTLSDSSVTLEGDMKNVKIAGESFRDSISAEGGGPSWLTSDVLTTTLAHFTGDLSDAELAAQGFNEAEIAAIQQTANTAKSAATEVKTISQLMGTLQESAGSGWSQTWQLIFGDFEEAKKTWTSVNKVLGDMIGASADARNAMLGDWKALGGRDAAIDAVKNAFQAVMAVLKPVKEAFREIFPPATGQQLYNITVAIRDFTAGLKIGAETSDNLKSTFKGVFAIFDIGLMVIKAALGMFAELFHGIGGGASSVLGFTGNIGDMIVRFRDSLKEGQGLVVIFSKIGTVLNIVIETVKAVVGAFADLFSGAATDGVAGLEGAIGRIKDRFEPLGGLVELLVSGWGKLGALFMGAVKMFAPLSLAMSEFFAGIGTKITEAVSNTDWGLVLSGINTGLFAALVAMLKKFLGGGINIDAGGGLFDSIKETLHGVTEQMAAMQAQLKASALIKIAGAIALLAASLAVLALIDPVKLGTALGAITIMFGQLIGSLAAFNAVTSTFGALKLSAAAVGLVILAGAIVILSTAVLMLSGLSWEELAKGLSAVTVLLGALAGTAKLLEGSTSGLARAGAGLMLVAIAVKILASAVEQFSGMDWAEMARGFAGVGAALTALALFTRLAETGKAAVAQGAGLLLLAAALKVIASAVEDFAGMDWATLGRGFAGMAGSLLLIAGAMQLMPKNMLVTAAALVVVAGALLLISSALGTMGGMSWEEIAKGLITLAGSLLIIAGALYLMEAALPGAAALIVAAGALAILTPVLLALGGMSWEEIGKGLAMLASTLLILGLAGLILTPVVPTLIGLGLAVALLGAGLALAGVGVLAFSTGLLALAVAVTVAGAGIISLVAGIIGLIPMALQALAEGIVAFALVIASSGPQMAAAMTAVMVALLNSINTVAPQIIATLVKLLFMLVDTIVAGVPRLVDSGMKLILGILTGISNNIGKIVTVALQIVTNFINGISAGIPGLVQAGINLVITFVNSIANGIRSNQGAMEAAGRNLAGAIIDGMVGGIGRGISSVVSAAKNMASSALNAAKSLLGIHSPSREFKKVGTWSTEGMAQGLDDGSPKVEASASNVGRNALLALKKSMGHLGDLAPDSIEINPTITPVLDLTEVDKGSKLIDKVLQERRQIDARSSASRAAVIAERAKNTEEGQRDWFDPQNMNLNPITFNQYNNSPKSLSHGEIYRNTKNQLSVLKGGTKIA